MNKFNIKLDKKYFNKFESLKPINKKVTFIPTYPKFFKYFGIYCTFLMEILEEPIKEYKDYWSYKGRIIEKRYYFLWINYKTTNEEK